MGGSGVGSEGRDVGRSEGGGSVGVGVIGEVGGKHPPLFLRRLGEVSVQDDVGRRRRGVVKGGDRRRRRRIRWGRGSRRGRRGETGKEEIKGSMQEGGNVKWRRERRGSAAGLTEEHPDGRVRVVRYSSVPPAPEVILPGAGPKGAGPETEPPLVGDEGERTVERDVLNEVCGHGDKSSVSGGRSVERVRVEGDDGVSVVT